jgi:hypothetical protein
MAVRDIICFLGYLRDLKHLLVNLLQGIYSLLKLEIVFRQFGLMRLR